MQRLCLVSLNFILIWQFVLEFVGGGTLEEFLHLGPQDPLSVTRKLKIGLDVSSGMVRALLYASITCEPAKASE